MRYLTLLKVRGEDVDYHLNNPNKSCYFKHSITDVTLMFILNQTWSDSHKTQCLSKQNSTSLTIQMRPRENKMKRMNLSPQLMNIKNILINILKS